MKKILVSLALVGALIITCLTGCQITPSNNTLETEKANAASVFTIDVNPGIRVFVDEDGKVIVVEATNEDGETVVTELDVEGVDFETVVEQIIDKMEEMGYIRGDENSVLISIEKQHKDISDKVNEKVEEAFEKHGKKASLIEQEIDKLDDEIGKAIDEMSEKYDISKGKAHLIEKIREEFPELSEEELANLGINDLRMMLEDASDDVKGHFEKIGKVIEEAYVGRELALAIALESLELSAEDIMMERVRAKCKGGAMLYEVNLVSGNMEYEVIIDAKTGDVIESESKEFVEFDAKAEIDEFCGKHGIDFDDIKDKINDIFGDHGYGGNWKDHEGEHEADREDRPLSKGELLHGLLNVLGVSDKVLEKTDVKLYESDNGTVYAVTVELENGDVYSLVVEAYSGTIIKIELNGEALEIPVE